MGLKNRLMELGILDHGLMALNRVLVLSILAMGQPMLGSSRMVLLMKESTIGAMAGSQIRIRMILVIGLIDKSLNP